MTFRAQIILAQFANAELAAADGAGWLQICHRDDPAASEILALSPGLIEVDGYLCLSVGPPKNGLWRPIGLVVD